MKKSVKSWAEDQFTATQKKDRQVLTAKESAWQDLDDRVAGQRALRLAKEAAENKSTEKAAVEKEVAKNK
jgi:hypothetical protein